MLQGLLLWGVCVTNLDVVLLAVGLGDGAVVEFVDHCLASVMVGEACKANTATGSISIAKDPLGTDIIAVKDGA